MWAALICPARMAWSCREVEGVHKMVNVLSYIWQSVNILWEENGIYRCHAGYPRHVRMMKDLKQARNEAEQANKAKSSFLPP